MASLFFTEFEFFEADTTQALLIRKPQVLCIDKYPYRNIKCNQNIAAAQNKAKNHGKFGLFCNVIECQWSVWLNSTKVTIFNSSPSTHPTLSDRILW